MKTRLSLRLALCALSLSMPITAFAVAPASVNGVKASFQNGKVTVSWTASTEADVTSYRVYYSRTSILDNGGTYDDFEPTEGKETTYVLKSIPAATSLFVAVTAVNSRGEESEYLGEEIEVKIAGGATGTASVGAGGSDVGSIPKPVNVSSSVLPTPVNTSMGNGTVALVSATASSSTGILLTFSENIRIAAADGPRAFVIRTASGDLLPLTRLVVDGKTVHIDTLVQTRNIVYTVEVGNVVFGMTDAATMNPAKRTATFMGHPKGVPQKPKSSKSSQASTFVSEVANINLTAQPQKDGTYTVTVDWRPGIDGDQVSGYTVRQTRDGGKSYSQEQQLPGSATSARFAKVPSGSFGVYIRTSAKSGNTSKGALGTINLPPITADYTTGGTRPIPGNTNPPPRGTTLPQSGPASVMVCLLAGACAGAMEARRRTKLQQA